MRRSSSSAWWPFVSAVVGVIVLASCVAGGGGGDVVFDDGPSLEEAAIAAAADGFECAPPIDLTDEAPRDERMDPKRSVECVDGDVALVVYEFAERGPAAGAESLIAPYGCWTYGVEVSWFLVDRLVVVADADADGSIDADALSSVVEQLASAFPEGAIVRTCPPDFGLSEAIDLDDILDEMEASEFDAPPFDTEYDPFTTTTVAPSSLVTEAVALRRDAVVHEWGDTVDTGNGTSVTVSNPRGGRFGDSWIEVDVRIENRSGALLDDRLEPRLVCAGSTDRGGVRVFDDADLPSDPIPDGAMVEGLVRMTAPTGDEAFDEPPPPCRSPAVVRLLYADGATDAVVHDFPVADELLVELNRR